MRKCVSKSRNDGILFCINDGVCGSYLVNGCHYDGCHCVGEFYGAHCQYNEETWKLGILDEISFPSIDAKFYTRDIDCRRNDLSIGFMFICAGSICFFLLFFVTLIKYVKAAKKLNDLQVQVTKELDRKFISRESTPKILCHEEGLEPNIREDVSH